MSTMNFASRMVVVASPWKQPKDAPWNWALRKFPGVFQARCGPFKGLWVLDPQQDKQVDLIVRESQQKYQLSDCKEEFDFEVLRTSSKPLHSDLTPNSIQALESLGASPELFMERQPQILETLRMVFDDDKSKGKKSLAGTFGQQYVQTWHWEATSWTHGSWVPLVPSGIPIALPPRVCWATFTLLWGVETALERGQACLDCARSHRHIARGRVFPPTTPSFRHCLLGWKGGAFDSSSLLSQQLGLEASHSKGNSNAP